MPKTTHCLLQRDGDAILDFRRSIGYDVWCDLVEAPKDVFLTILVKQAPGTALFLSLIINQRKLIVVRKFHLALLGSL